MSFSLRCLSYRSRSRKETLPVFYGLQKTFYIIPRGANSPNGYLDWISRIGASNTVYVRHAQMVLLMVRRDAVSLIFVELKRTTSPSGTICTSTAVSKVGEAVMTALMQAFGETKTTVGHTALGSGLRAGPSSRILSATWQVNSITDAAYMVDGSTVQTSTKSFFRRLLEVLGPHCSRGFGTDRKGQGECTR